ncbi:MAG: PQQ-dependent sugar dehydrogenase [Patescibacteria group bacterium]|jgi:glucose/arabinose dehydrogenase
MKKIILVIVAVIFLVAIGWAGIYLWKNYGGFLRNIEEPSVNIVNSLENQNISPLPPNSTKIPLTLPNGFSISIFAKNLGAPRVVISDEAGRLLASVPSAGKIFALPDKNQDGAADETIEVLSGLNNPHGLALWCENEKCSLYVAESDKLSVYDYDKEKAAATNGKKIVDLPGGGRHFTRTLQFLPNNPDKILISVGSSCDVCNESDWQRAKVLVVDIKTGELKVFSSGLRNSVFMAEHPVTGKIWATEMGRDFLGDNLPPDEINIIEDEKNYGWPICYGKNIHDTVFDKNVYIRNPCMEPFETPSYIDIPAHSAPLGLAFVAEGSGWPKDYENNLLVAYHGSWNRSVPAGYKIVRYKLDAEGKYLGEEDFIFGWLAGGEVLGRPAGILFFDGAAYVSDDKAGVIYKITYHP